MGDLVFIDFTRDEPILTKDEIAQRLGYDKRTIERLTKEGMPADIFGIRRVYKEAACRNWLAQRDRKGSASCHESAVGGTG